MEESAQRNTGLGSVEDWLWAVHTLIEVDQRFGRRVKGAEGVVQGIRGVRQPSERAAARV